MIDIKIIPAIPGHIRDLLEELKELDKDDAYRFGADNEKVLIRAYDRSLYTNTALVDGKVIAVWGVIGSYLGEEGRPWSIMSPETEKYPFKFKSFYSHELDKMLQLFPVLVDMVDIRHIKVLRMLKLMGFAFKEPAPFMDGIFIKAERRL